MVYIKQYEHFEVKETEDQTDGKEALQHQIPGDCYKREVENFVSYFRNRLIPIVSNKRLCH